MIEARVPDADYFIAIRRREYVNGFGYLTWFIDRASAIQLTSNPARRSRFESHFNHPDPWTITLPDEPRTSRTDILLQPGVNLVGAPEGGVSLQNLFAQSDQLVGIITLDRDGTPERTVFRGQLERIEPELMLGEGQIAWMYVSGDRPVTVGWDASRRGYGVSRHQVQANGGYVIWRSTQPTSLADAVRGLGPLESDPLIASTERGQFAYRTAGTARQGHVIWVNSPVQQFPLIKSDFEPRIIYIGRDDQSLQREFQTSFDSVRRFFFDAYGLMLSQIDVEVYAGSGIPEYLRVRCGLSGQTIRIACLDEMTIAREYTRGLQHWLSAGAGEPGWLIVGAMEYAAAMYEQAESGLAGDPIAPYRILRQQALGGMRFDNWEASEIERGRSESILAVDWLVQHASGYDAIWDCFRRAREQKYVWRGNDTYAWQVAFEAAFGLTIDSFYREFAAYRADGFE